MTEESIRRTFNINNFESLVVEGHGRNSNGRKAYLMAELDCLNKAVSSLIRIYHIRSEHGTSSEFDNITYSMITKEIEGITAEIANL